MTINEDLTTLFSDEFGNSCLKVVVEDDTLQALHNDSRQLAHEVANKLGFRTLRYPIRYGAINAETDDFITDGTDKVKCFRAEYVFVRT